MQDEVSNKQTVSIRRFPYAELGHSDYGWLDARYHFSFARYWNPQRTGFGRLLVINDDVVAAGRGFDTHPHDNMEIITYVRQGAITHRDSLGNEGRTGAGDVQVMSAGTGVTHSEYNQEEIDTRLYQIWIEPAQINVQPRWETREFPKSTTGERLTVLASGQPKHEGTPALLIHQDAAIYGGRLVSKQQVSVHIEHQAYVLVSYGTLNVNGCRLMPGDGAEVTATQTLIISAETDAEVLVIDVPA